MTSAFFTLLAMPLDLGWIELFYKSNLTYHHQLANFGSFLKKMPIRHLVLRNEIIKEEKK